MEVRPRALAKCSKRHCIRFHSPFSSHIKPSTMRDTEIVSKMGHTVIVGLPTLRVQRQNLLDGLEPPRATRVRDKGTQVVATSWHIRSRIKGTQHPQALYLSLDWEVSFMPLCGLASSHPGFLCGLPRKEV
jgi:hypothetical protein